MHSTKKSQTGWTYVAIEGSIRFSFSRLLRADSDIAKTTNPEEQKQLVKKLLERLFDEDLISLHMDTNSIQFKHKVIKK